MHFYKISFQVLPPRQSLPDSFQFNWASLSEPHTDDRELSTDSFYIIVGYKIENGIGNTSEKKAADLSAFYCDNAQVKMMRRCVHV